MLLCLYNFVYARTYFALHTDSLRRPLKIRSVLLVKRVFLSILTFQCSSSNTRIENKRNFRSINTGCSRLLIFR